MANNPVMNSVMGQKINNVIDPGKTFDLQCDPNEIARSDYCQSLSQFFGPAPRNLTPNPEAKRPHEAYFLPDAFKGRNDFLSNTIVDVVIAQNSFMTRHVLPMQHREDPTLRWASFSFDRTLADYEPEQGVPRYVTLKSSSREDYMQRRGLAFYMNHGFANTDMGRMDFKMKIAAIVNAIKETLDQEALLAILNAKNMYKSQEAKAARAMTTVEARMALARDRWACVQKEERGWLMLDADLSDSMNRQGVHADTWIVPPRMAMYATIAQPAETEYYRAGPAARRNLAENGSEKSYTRWRGSTLYEIKPYHLDNDDVDLCHLERERVIGDYFVVRDFAFGRYPKKNGNSNEYDDGQVQQQATLTDVYCCESDKFETFKLADAIKKTGVFKPDLSDYSEAFTEWFDGDFKGPYDLDNMRTEKLLEGDTMAFSDKGKKLFMPCMYVDLNKQCLELIPITDQAQEYVNNMRRAGWVSRDDCCAPGECGASADGVAMCNSDASTGLFDIITTTAVTLERNILGKIAGHVQAAYPGEFSQLTETKGGEDSLNFAISKANLTQKENEEWLLRYNYYAALLVLLCDSYDESPMPLHGDAGALQQSINTAVGGLVLHSTEAMAASVVPPDETYKQTIRTGAKWLRSLNDDHGIAHSKFSQSKRMLEDLLSVSRTGGGDGGGVLPGNAALQTSARALYALGTVADASTTAGTARLDEKTVHRNVAVARAALQFAAQHPSAPQLISVDSVAQNAATNELRAIVHEIDAKLVAQGGGTADSKEDVEFLRMFVRKCCVSKPESHVAIERYVDAGEMLIGSKTHLEMLRLAIENDPNTIRFGGINCKQSNSRGLLTTTIQQSRLLEWMCRTFVTLRDAMFKAQTDHDYADTPAFAQACCQGQWALLGIGVDGVVNGVFEQMHAVCGNYCCPDISDERADDAASSLWPPVEQLDVVNRTFIGLKKIKESGTPLLMLPTLLRPDYKQASGVLKRPCMRTFSIGWCARDVAEDLLKDLKGSNFFQTAENAFIDLVSTSKYAWFLKTISENKSIGADALIRAMDTCGGPGPDFSLSSVSPSAPPLTPPSVSPRPGSTTRGGSTSSWLGNAFSVLCSRPFRSYTMGSAIKCKAGKDLGVTAHGYEDMQLSDDIISHVYVGHFTIWAAAVVFNEKLACVIDDIFCSGYNGGEGRHFVKRDDWKNDQGYADPYRYVLHDSDGGRGCIFAYLMPPHFDNAASATFEWNCAQNPIDITGTLHTHVTDTAAPSERDYRFPCAKANAEWWLMNNLRDSNPSAMACEEYSEKYYAPETVVNTVCFQTMQTVVGGSGKAGDLHRGAAIWNTDHFGREGVYAGVKGVRTGKLAHFKDQGYEGRYVTL